MPRHDFYDDATYEGLVARIEQLTAETAPQWGKMNAAQMCAHCAEIAEVAGGEKALEGTPWLVRLFSGLIRKMVLSGKPYPRSSKTHPQYIMADAHEFAEEKARLLSVLASLKAAGSDDGVEHPLFGSMSAAEKGWAGYKHLDHHLSQFGV